MPYLDEGLIYAAATDITEKREMLQEVARAHEELEERVRVALREAT
jgi:hypothetical protein